MRYVPKEDDELTPAEIAERERQMTSFVKSKADELATTAADHAAPIKSFPSTKAIPVISLARWNAHLAQILNGHN